MVLLLLHLMQTLVAGAYRKPREFNWWLGLALLVLTIGFGHTGYQLPWDQKGYWATKVVTNIMGGAPVIGPYLKTVVVGGTEYGNQTLTRFYGLHVGILPVLMLLCFWAHVSLARRHGLTASPRVPTGRPTRRTGRPRPSRTRSSLAAVFATMAILVVIDGGAPLDAPADPSSADYPARPEWFFLCLFQMLKHFPGRLEWVGSIVIPSTILLVLFLLPLLDRILPSRFLHFLACTFLFALVGRRGLPDRRGAPGRCQRQAVQARPAEGRRGREAGALPRLQPRGRHPARRGRVPDAPRPPHPRAGGAGEEVPELPCPRQRATRGAASRPPPTSRISARAPGFADCSRIPRSPAYFGKVPRLGGMVEWKKSSELKSRRARQGRRLRGLVRQHPGHDDARRSGRRASGSSEHPGQEAFETECGQCHKIEGFTEGGQRKAPNLFAWGSPQWITRMIREPVRAGPLRLLQGKGPHAAVRSRPVDGPRRRRWSSAT